MGDKTVSIVNISIISPAFHSYRLAPEHVFPAGFSDCVKAIKYFLRHAHTYDVDSSRIAVAGK